MTNAESLYRRLDSGEAVADLQRRKEPESAYLEFKGCKSSEGGEWSDLPDEKIKAIWSEAISGFANSGGGVLVWGIDARQGPDGIDCAKSLIPHSNAAKLRSRLIELGHDATDPPLMGLDCKAFVKAGESEAGFVVALIPEGNSQPYQARWADEHYYFRCGDSFRKADRAMLRKLFYPRVQSRLVPQLSFEAKKWTEKKTIPASAATRNRPTKRTEFHDGFEVSFGLKNEGTATAEDAYIEFAGTKSFVSVIPQGSRGSGEWIPTASKQLLRSERPIHISRLVSLGIPFPISLEEVSREPTNKNLDAMIHGSVKIYARDAEVREYSFDMECQAIDQRLKEGGSFTIEFDEVND